MLKRIKISGLICILSLTLFLLFSCNEKPTELGFSLLYDTITVVGTSNSEYPFITGAESFLNRESLFNIGAIFIGKSDSIKAISFLRFSRLPDSLKISRLILFL